MNNNKMTQMDFQCSFLETLQTMLKDLSGCVLWSIAPIKMKLKVELPDSSLMSDVEKIETIITTEITRNLMFGNLIELGWKNSFVKNVKKETRVNFVWRKKRTKKEPYGKVKYFASWELIHCGTDEAGSVWHQYERGPWELVDYNENYEEH